MSEQVSAEQKPQINLNMVQVLDLGCGILHQAFIKQAADKAKALLKEVKGGKTVSLGAITLTQRNDAGEAVQEIEIPLSLELDYTEFVGGFNHPAFEAALRGMLNEIAVTMRAKKDLNILTNQETGGWLIHRPGMIEKDGQLNVLVLAIEPGKKHDFIFRLMFVNPAQYEDLRKEQAS